MAIGLTQRDSIIEHTTQIRQLIHDASSFLTELHVQQQQYYSIQWLVHFDVFPQVPLPPNSVSYEHVASECKIPVSVLRSVMRMAMTVGLFRETADGYISHNVLSAAFVEDAAMRVQLRHFCNATVPIMASLVQATEKWGDTTASNQTAYNIAQNTELPFFEHLKSRTDLQQNFENYMKSKAVSHKGSSAEHLLKGFAWQTLGEATIVDVGGSSGATAIMLATHYPQLRFVVQDLAGPIASAHTNMASLPVDIRSRLSAIVHDFFQPQPQKAADVYLLRTILHDWPDADAIKIVKNLADVMAPSSRLLIMDMVLPKPGSSTLTYEAALRQKDLMMLGTFNAKEREIEEWAALIETADSRLAIKDIVRPPGSELSVIEIVLKDDVGGSFQNSVA